MALSNIQILGLSGTILSIVAYGVGMVVAYPGREVSLPLGMVALTLLALGGVGGDGS